MKAPILSALCFLLTLNVFAQAQTPQAAAAQEASAAPVKNANPQAAQEADKKPQAFTPDGHPIRELKMPDGQDPEIYMGGATFDTKKPITLDTSTEKTTQETLFKMLLSLEKTQQDLLTKSYTALLYAYSPRGAKGAEELRALLNGKTAKEIIELGKPYSNLIPSGLKFDASSEEKFQASLAFAMMTLSEDKKHELAAAIAKVILKGSKEGKTPAESIKALNGMDAQQIIEHAKDIDIKLPETL